MFTVRKPFRWVPPEFYSTPTHQSQEHVSLKRLAVNVVNFVGINPCLPHEQKSLYANFTLFFTSPILCFTSSYDASENHEICI